MIYFDEMLDKSGFSDGDVEPVEARVCRTAYIRAINILAEKLLSEYRAVAYNRPGMHNSRMILFVPSAEAPAEKDLILETAKDLHSVRFGAVDAAMQQAVDIASELNLDECVEVQVRLDEAELHNLIQEGLKRL